MPRLQQITINQLIMREQLQPMQVVWCDLAFALEDGCARTAYLPTHILSLKRDNVAYGFCGKWH